jgi:hypothetical protein
MREEINYFSDARGGRCFASLTLFEPPCYGVARAEVAQLAEHSPEKAGVDSSILSLGTIQRSFVDVSLRRSLLPTL